MFFFRKGIGCTSDVSRFEVLELLWEIIHLLQQGYIPIIEGPNTCQLSHDGRVVDSAGLFLFLLVQLQQIFPFLSSSMILALIFREALWCEILLRCCLW